MMKFSVSSHGSLELPAGWHEFEDAKDVSLRSKKWSEIPSFSYR